MRYSIEYDKGHRLYHAVVSQILLKFQKHAFTIKIIR
jgi:hypothetical protein